MKDNSPTVSNRAMNVIAAIFFVLSHGSLLLTDYRLAIINCQLPDPYLLALNSSSLFDFDLMTSHTPVKTSTTATP